MASILRRVSCVPLVAALAVVVLAQFGCGGTSPFLAAQFADNILLVPRRGPPADGGGGVVDGGTGTTVTSVCDLDAGLRTIEVTLQNEAPFRVRFAMTFLASAGGTGFVCDDEVQTYLDADYTEANLSGSPPSITIGCDTIPLASGDAILRRNFGADDPFGEQILQAGTEATPTILQLGFSQTGVETIPLPEAIVFGSSDAEFECVSNSLCTQRGFLFVNNSTPPVVITGVEATNIQGTFCSEQTGTAPEWRLDKTINDTQVADTQYPAGGTILVTIRDADTGNIVVWTVTDSNGGDVHNPQP